MMDRRKFFQILAATVPAVSLAQPGGVGAAASNSFIDNGYRFGPVRTPKEYALGYRIETEYETEVGHFLKRLRLLKSFPSKHFLPRSE